MRLLWGPQDGREGLVGNPPERLYCTRAHTRDAFGPVFLAPLGGMPGSRIVDVYRRVRINDGLRLAVYTWQPKESRRRAEV